MGKFGLPGGYIYMEYISFMHKWKDPVYLAANIINKMIEPQKG
jgi:hypothetical protein